MAAQPNTPENLDPDANDPAETVTEDHLERVRVRRAPKFSVFMILGGAVGLFTAMILTFLYDGTANQSPNTGMVYSQGQVFGFLALICVAIGLAVFGGIALLLDRASRKHAHEITVDRETVHRFPEV